MGGEGRRYNRGVLKPHSKAPRGLVALGSVAIIAVYGAGYARTRTAGSRFAETPALRRPAPPAAMVKTAAVRASEPAAEPAAPATPKPAAPRPGPHRESHSATKASGEKLPESGTPAAPAVVSPVASKTPTPAPTPASPASVAVTETALSDAAAAKPAVDSTAPKAAPDPPAPPAAKAGWKDGTYYGWGSSRHGDIQAAIVIVEGRIAGASIAQCLTRYSCSWIAHLPAQVIARQSADVDFVTGATQSVDAFYYAVLDALSKAK